MACVYLLEDCNGFGYIGSTINFRQRLHQHNSIRNKKTCSKYLTKPFKSFILEKIEDDDNLYFAEQFYIKLYKDLYGEKLLNKNTPLRTKKEWCNENREKLNERRKQYYIENKDKQSEAKKEYYIENKNMILHHCKIYRDENKDKIKTRDKIYYNKNKDKILERQSKIIECECGTILTSNNKPRHLKSKKHQNFLDAQSS